MQIANYQIIISDYLIRKRTSVTYLDTQRLTNHMRFSKVQR